MFGIWAGQDDGSDKAARRDFDYILGRQASMQRPIVRLNPESRLPTTSSRRSVVSIHGPALLPTSCNVSRGKSSQLSMDNSLNAPFPQHFNSQRQQVEPAICPASR
jgi:hypothetical protein